MTAQEIFPFTQIILQANEVIAINLHNKNKIIGFFTKDALPESQQTNKWHFSSFEQFESGKASIIDGTSISTIGIKKRY